MLFLALLSLAPAVVAAGLLQQPLQAPFYDDAYTVVTHDAYPNHTLRLRTHNALSTLDVHANGEKSITAYCEGATSGLYCLYLPEDEM